MNPEERRQESFLEHLSDSEKRLDASRHSVFDALFVGIIAVVIVGGLALAIMRVMTPAGVDQPRGAVTARPVSTPPVVQTERADKAASRPAPPRVQAKEGLLTDKEVEELTTRRESAPQAVQRRASVAPKAGVVTILQGHATAREPAVPHAVPLKVDDDLFLVDTIATGGGSRIEMLLGGKARVAMQERSTVSITEVPGRSTLALQAGQLAMSLAGAGMRPGEELQVRTPNAVAAVRGGVRMSVETLPATQAGRVVVTHVDVLEGSILVATGAGTPRPARTLDANRGLTITGDAVGPIRALRPMSPPTKEGHDAQP